MDIDFSNLRGSKLPPLRNEKLFKEYPSIFKKDKKSRKIKDEKIEDLMDIHKDLNPFIINENATSFGHFDVRCKTFNNEKGEVIGYSEEMPFARIYKNEENLMTVSNLTPKGKALFLWIIYSVYPSVGFVFLNEKRIMKNVPGLYSPNSLRNAIEEMCKAKILKAYIHPYYWINPRFLFLGNRAYAYPEYRNVRHFRVKKVEK